MSENKPVGFSGLAELESHLPEHDMQPIKSPDTKTVSYKSRKDTENVSEEKSSPSFFIIILAVIVTFVLKIILLSLMDF